MTILKLAVQFSFTILLFVINACKEGEQTNRTNNVVTVQPIPPTNSSSKLNSPSNSILKMDKQIRSIYQDRHGNYWFGTNDAGVYCLKPQKANSDPAEKRLMHFTAKDGLPNNQVQHIQEDKLGNIWFTVGGFGVSQFDGQHFTTYTSNTILPLQNGGKKDWKIVPNDLWFYAGGGVFHYSNHSFVYLPFNLAHFNSNLSQHSPFNLSPFAVYSMLKDTKGNLWFGTQSQGVCKYDGKSLVWFTEKGLSGPAVLALFEDRNGNIWFGNNGAGLFKYDGKSIVNVTAEKGLGNKDFKVSGKPGLGTMARIYSINEDNYGTLWIGTVDAGVWQFDGSNLTNYTIKNGLTSNAINCIFKDNHGELWFGTDNDGICKFNGKSFVKFDVQ